MNEWILFTDKKPEENKWLLVTNRIDARDAHGEMSHLWLTTFWTWSEKYKQYVTFSDDIMVHNLTHWRYALPEGE